MSMLLILIPLLSLPLLVVAYFLFKRFPKKRLKRFKFTRKWRDLQKMCSKPEAWPDAILRADHLLNEALKKRHFNGKSMGERMVAAQRTFQDNEAVWAAHNLAKKLTEQPGKKLTKNQVVNTLTTYRNALKDLGAL